MSQKNWDKYEVALLIETYQNIKQGRVDKNSALIELSQNLRKMALIECYEVDDIFRNLNGMQWQLSVIDRAFSGERCGTRMPPRIFNEMALLYKNNPQEYYAVLKRAHEIIEMGETSENSIQKTVERQKKTILDIVGNDYPDFVEFCDNAGKIYPDDLEAVDYIAFRTQYNVTREYVSIIKTRLIAGMSLSNNNDIIADIEESEGVDESASDKVDDFETTQVDTRNEILFQPNIKGNTDVLDNDTYPFNIYEPLYRVFNVDTPEFFRGILIEALGFNIKVKNILKGDGRKSVEDLLRVSITEIFDLNTISKSSLFKILKIIRQFVSNDLNSIEYKLLKTSVPLYELFSVECPEDYEYVSINEFGFSTRFWNQLQQHKISNTYSLLLITVGEMLQWGGLGRKSIIDAIELMYSFFATKEGQQELLAKRTLPKAEINLKIKDLINKTLSGEDVDLSYLDDKQKRLFTSYLDAIEDCGEEIYFAVEKNPISFANLCNCLRDFSEQFIKAYNAYQHILESYNNIPTEYRNRNVKLFVDAYYTKNNDTLKSFWATIQSESTFSDLLSLIKALDTNSEYNMEDFVRLFDWVSGIDLPNILQNIFSNNAFVKKNRIDDDIKGRYWQAIEMRAAGKTLEEIGNSIGTTRERIRQIEQRTAKQFAEFYKSNSYDLLSIIHALRGGDNVLRKEEVESIIGERHTNLLWLILSKGLLDCKTYKYASKYDSVVFTSDIEEETRKLKTALEALPDCFMDDQFDYLVNETVETYHVNSELIQIEIDTLYKRYGRFYSRTALTVTFMCGYILKQMFPHGFKIGVEEEAQRLKAHMIDLFGNKGDMTYRAIDNKIGEVGVLCDRGLYIHPDYVDVDTTIIDEINKFIGQSPKSVLTYSEIFDSLRSVLDGTQITNRFILQGVLKLYGCPYTTTRDYVTKDTGKNLTDEFEEFARERGEFHKTDFYAAFPSMTDANLGMLVGRCQDVFSIDNGIYMHASQLHITETDYTEIKKYLDNVCRDVPVSSRYLYDEFGYRFIDFLTANEINGHGKLFGILSYMFANDYVFSRPYISKKKHRGMTQKDVIMMRLEGYDTLFIDEVVSICEENGIRFGSIPSLIKILMPEFVRVNENMLMRYELTGITDKIISDTAKIVLQRVETNRYVCSSQFDDFIFFPHMEIGWNPFLLESIIELANDAVHIIKIPMQAYTVFTSIFVSDEFANDEYQLFILKLLSDAYDKSYFTTKSELREWLNERGLIVNNNLPKFLEGVNYYYMDESGILRKRGEANV